MNTVQCLAGRSGTSAVAFPPKTRLSLGHGFRWCIHSPICSAHPQTRCFFSGYSSSILPPPCEIVNSLCCSPFMWIRPISTSSASPIRKPPNHFFDEVIQRPASLWVLILFLPVLFRFAPLWLRATPLVPRFFPRDVFKVHLFTNSSPSLPTLLPFGLHYNRHAANNPSSPSTPSVPDEVCNPLLQGCDPSFYGQLVSREPSPIA